MKHPTGLLLSLGTPAPSFVGVSLSYQAKALLQILASTGSFWSGELHIQSLQGSARIHMLESDFTPMLGAGVSVFLFSGQGSIQTLDASTALGSLLIGVDWAFDFGLRLCAGYTFHYPLRLNFPFFDVGWNF